MIREDFFSSLFSWPRRLQVRLSTSPALGADGVSVKQTSLAPGLISPSNNAHLSNMGPILLKWESTVSAIQYHLRVIPANNDGPGINIVVGDLARVLSASHVIEPPVLGQGNYLLLPGMSYTWQVRTATALVSLGENDPLWGSWSDSWRFATPAPSSKTISSVAPEEGESVSQSGAVLRWQNSATDIFYYEIQVSKDARFTTEEEALTSVWSNLVHGGVANPLNSWSTPELQPNSIYYWQVRPRVQGDGDPVEWSAAWGFTTAGSRSDKALEHEALIRINKARQTNNLPPLNEVDEIVRAAFGHSQDMAARESISHAGSDGSDPGQRIKRANYDWKIHGEIVAFGFETADAVVDAWMNSPTHRDVILTRRFDDFGAGPARAKNGTTYWTVNFGSRR